MRSKDRSPLTEITLPLPQNRAQDGGFWAKKHHEKKTYLDFCLFPLYRALGPFPRPDERAMFQKVRISATMYVWSRNDPDAVQGRLKWAIDALVQYRFIPDDTADHVELGEVTQEIDRQNMRLVLSIEEVPS